MKYLFIITLTYVSLNLFSQEISQRAYEPKHCVTVGILQGGGSLLGADLEFLVSDYFGLQLGAGLIGFGGGANLHFKPSIRSSFLSFNYWHQGVGESFAQDALGATYVFRGRKWFTFQIGLGVPLEKGPAMPVDFEQPPAMLLYSIGAYFPF